MNFCVISCTNRPCSKTLTVSKKITEFYQSCSLLDLTQTLIFQIKDVYKDSSPIKKELEVIHQSQGVVLVLPEYNGSYPGIFKYFLDHWDEVQTFSNRVFCLVGIGMSVGAGIGAVRHIQNVLNHQGAVVYPKSVYVHGSTVDENHQTISQTVLIDRLKQQAQDFQNFTQKFHSHSSHN